MRPPRALAAAVLLTACVEPIAGYPPAAPAQPPAAPALPPSAPAYPPAAPASPPAPATPPASGPVDARAQIELPFSTTRAPVPAGLPLVLVSRTMIAVQGDQTSAIPLSPSQGTTGADAAYKRSGPNDLFLVPLAAALGRSPLRTAGVLLVGADASAPYRVIIEVLFTAGQSSVDTFHFLTRTASGFGSITMRPPKFGAPPDPMVTSLDLTVLITREGISIKAVHANVAPGCAGRGRGVALPRGPAGLDLAGLSACAASLRRADPSFATETRAILTANPDIPFGEVIAVMDALRSEPSGAAGFPDITFGIAR